MQSRKEKQIWHEVREDSHVDQFEVVQCEENRATAYIELSNIKALTKSLDAKRATSFIVHVASEYDYQFDSDYRDDIFA